MKSHVMLYPTPTVEISGHWTSPRPPGWDQEGGWLAFNEGYGPPNWDIGQGLTIYLNREQALRLQRIINELIEKMPDPTGPQGVEVSVR